MLFNSELSFSSFNDAWHTYKTHFNKNAKLEDFLLAASKSHPQSIKISEIIKLNPLNLNLARLNAKTTEEAYPLNDRPRGIADIKSIKYHQKKECSPIVMIRDKQQVIFADGVHRLIATKLLGKRTIICHIIEV